MDVFGSFPIYLTMTMPITGGCMCGAVRYESSAEPLLMVKCHCRDCQRTTGGPYVPAVVFPISAFRVVQGQVQHYATPKFPQRNSRTS
jgi:hypothetical protein